MTAYFNFGGTTTVPVIVKEVRNIHGSCFNLQNQEKATLEQTFQGWTIELNPDLEWNVYLSARGITHPTYSSSVPYQFFTLQPRSHTFISFVANKYIKIRTKGPVQREPRCNEDSDYIETMACEKKCFLDTFKVC